MSVLVQLTKLQSNGMSFPSICPKREPDLGGMALASICIPVERELGTNLLSPVKAQKCVITVRILILQLVYVVGPMSRSWSRCSSRSGHNRLNKIRRFGCMPMVAS